MPVVVALAEADRQPGQPVAWRAEAPVGGTWPGVAARPRCRRPCTAALAANAAPPAPRPAPPSASFVAALLGALIGGLLLNLMPCVFPVLAIKVLGFTRHADDRARPPAGCPGLHRPA